MRYKQPREYIERALGPATGGSIQEEFEVGRNELPFEFMLNLLRLPEGFATHLFSERTGLALGSIEASLQKAEARGLIECDHLRIRPTLRGLRFLNDLQTLFLPGASPRSSKAVS
jgi:oxygen-independent coproporphyrinogen-3 oxidase